MRFKATALLVIALLVASSMVSIGCGKKPEPKVFKVAAVLPGPINDAGWNASAHAGLVMAKEKNVAEVAFSENVQPADFESALRDYASKGYDLIIAHGFQFQDAVHKIAPSFKNSKFIVINGDKLLEPNVASYKMDSTQTGFLAGYVSAYLSKTGVVGVMVANKAPAFNNVLEGYEAGAKYAKPGIKVLTAYTDTTTDINKGKEIALAFIEQGADFIHCAANQVGLGSIAACKEKGIKATGMNSDQNSVAPETVVVSALQNTGLMIFRAIEGAVKGEFKAEVRFIGVKEEAVGLSPWHQHEAGIPQELKTKLVEILAKMKDGSLRSQGILPQAK